MVYTLWLGVKVGGGGGGGGGGGDCPPMSLPLPYGMHGAWMANEMQEVECVGCGC